MLQPAVHTKFLLRFWVAKLHGRTAVKCIVISDSERDHSDCDCFAMAILSHGDEGQVFGVDGAMQIKKLVEPLKRCGTLHDKPKLFIIQVCMKKGGNGGQRLYQN